MMGHLPSQDRERPEYEVQVERTLRQPAIEGEVSGKL
jgi:hypothetical protein